MRGFSLLETILAFTILVVLVVFIFQLVPSSVLAIRTGSIEIAAQNLAVSTLEGYRTQPYSNLVAGTHTVLDGVYGPGQVYLVPNVDVNLVPPDGDPQRILEVSVNVTWQYRSQDHHLVMGMYRWNVQQ